MAKGKDYYGGAVTDVIAKACKDLSVAQEELNIEILETGSSGIFGLCRKKAHIRVTRKEKQPVSSQQHTEERSVPPEKQPEQKKAAIQKATAESASESDHQETAAEPERIPETEVKSGKKAKSTQKSASKPVAQKNNDRKTEKSSQGKSGAHQASEPSQPPELPSDEAMASIQEDITTMLEIMGFPSTVTVGMEKHTVACRISDEHKDDLVGRDGRTLDSLQYLLRKMSSRRLPDRTMLSLDVGNYRERRAGELQERALELADQVREDGKTQAIAALNPSERRVVHMTLQEDKSIRSRSVGEGLFKKVLIYKPGRKKSHSSRTGKGAAGGTGKDGDKGQQGDHPSGDK
jgi:spoIIIJ-associated protein